MQLCRILQRQKYCICPKAEIEIHRNFRITASSHQWHSAEIAFVSGIHSKSVLVQQHVFSHSLDSFAPVHVSWPSILILLFLQVPEKADSPDGVLPGYTSL